MNTQTQTIYTKLHALDIQSSMHSTIGQKQNSKVLIVPLRGLLVGPPAGSGGKQGILAHSDSLTRSTHNTHARRPEDGPRGVPVIRADDGIELGGVGNEVEWTVVAAKEWTVAQKNEWMVAANP